jgi:hypothetical protein
LIAILKLIFHHNVEIQPYKEKLAQCINSMEMLSDLLNEFKTKLQGWN